MDATQRLIHIQDLLRELSNEVCEIQGYLAQSEHDALIKWCEVNKRGGKGNVGE